MCLKCIHPKQLFERSGRGGGGTKGGGARDYLSGEMAKSILNYQILSKLQRFPKKEP